MTQCCNHELYLSDVYCPKCGEEAHHTDTVKSAFDIDPTITASFSGHGKPFTGQVIDTYYYRRTQGDMEYGYLWLTLEDTNKNIKEFSINGEGDTFQNIKVGDVLSVISPQGVNLYYPISSGDKKIISNDISPGIVTYHREDDVNCSSIDSCISNPQEASPSIFNCTLVASISIIFAWYMYTKQQVYIDNPWFIGSCVLPILCFFFASRTKKTNNKNMLYAKSAEEALSALKKVFYSSLGYQIKQRPPSNNDVLCLSCSHAIDCNAEHCCQCGDKVEKESPVEIQDTIESSSFVQANDTPIKEENCSITTSVITSSDVIPTEPLAHSVNENKGNITVRAHNQAISEQYELIEEHNFIYKHTLTRNKEHTVYCSASLVKVVSKHMGANANEGSIATTRTTNYKNRYGVIVDSKTETSYEPYRNLILAGYLTVENANGDTYAFDSNDYILRSSNVGDLIYIGECTLKRKGKYQKFLEYVYHVNKGELINGNNSFDKYQIDFSAFSIFNFIIIALLSIPTLGIPFIFICIVNFSFASNNKVNKNKAVANIKNILKKCIKNRSEILKNFK